MKCVFCKKILDSTKIKEISFRYGKNSVCRLVGCKECLEKRYIVTNSVIMKGTGSHILYSILQDKPKFENMRHDLIKCKDCKTSLFSILATGKVGCKNCYIVFEKDISALVFAGENKVYSGIIPKFKTKTKSQKYRNYLKEQLDKSVKLDDFETAALIRDKIYNIDNTAQSNKQNNAKNSNINQDIKKQNDINRLDDN